MSNWISVDDGLPEEFQDVLAYIPPTPTKCILICWRDGRYWESATTITHVNQPTHWQPLPEPPDSVERSHRTDPDALKEIQRDETYMESLIRDATEGKK